MASQLKRRAQNVSGAFFVDSTCIDCGTCYWMLPEVFSEVGSMSAVTRQPLPEQELRACEAIVSCPVGSIGGPNAKRAVDSFPKIIEETPTGRVSHCGYHSESSFGAASYFIERPDGNILIDSPRFAAPLVKEIEKRGGVKWMVFTHRDDVADHQKFHDHFACDRVIHRGDLAAGTRDFEILIEGQGAQEILPSCQLIPVPGHTRGHIVILYENKFLFTGDHLAWSPELQSLYAFKNACWYSWPEQIHSMEKLRDLRFEWVLPGHDAPFHGTADESQAQIEKCISWMKAS